jgi:cytochrome c-type biogenesis protein CcmH
MSAPEQHRGPGHGSAATLLLMAAVLVATAAIAFLALRGPTAPSSLQGRARAVAEGLRCPSCQSLSVADSPSPIAAEIRRDIERRLAAGEPSGAITAYYVSRYGPWILLSPPKSGVTLAAWVLPLLLLGAGLVLLSIALRRWTSRRTPRLQHAPGDSTPERRPGRDRLSAADRTLLDRARAGLPTVDEPE